MPYCAWLLSDWTSYMFLNTPGLHSLEVFSDTCTEFKILQLNDLHILIGKKTKQALLKNKYISAHLGFSMDWHNTVHTLLHISNLVKYN